MKGPKKHKKGCHCKKHHHKKDDHKRQKDHRRIECDKCTIINITYINNGTIAREGSKVHAETGGQISGKNGINANQGGQINVDGGQNANQAGQIANHCGKNKLRKYKVDSGQ